MEHNDQIGSRSSQAHRFTIGNKMKMRRGFSAPAPGTETHLIAKSELLLCSERYLNFKN